MMFFNLLCSYVFDVQSGSKLYFFTNSCCFSIDFNLDWLHFISRCSSECNQHLILDLHWVRSVRIRSYCGPHFPAFELNTERCSVSLSIQSEYGKMQTRITPNTDTFYATLIALSFPLFSLTLGGDWNCLSWFLCKTLFFLTIISASGMKIFILFSNHFSKAIS